MFTLRFDCLLNVVMHAFCVISRVGRGCGFVIRRSRPNFSRGSRKIVAVVKKLVAMVEK